MHLVARTAVVVVAAVLLDSLYFHFSFKELYEKVWTKILHEDRLNIRVLPAALAWTLIGVSVVVACETSDPRWSVPLCAFWGLAVYGVYNCTTLSVVDKLPLLTAVVDTLWGVVVYTSLALLYTRVLNNPEG